MGLNPNKIKYLQYFIETGMTSLDNINVKSHIDLYSKNFFNNDDPYLDFEVIDKWKEIKIMKNYS
jgi:hypothetical protein